MPRRYIIIGSLADEILNVYLQPIRDREDSLLLYLVHETQLLILQRNLELEF